MKKPKRIRKVKSFTQRIKELEEQIALLNECKEFEFYFKQLKNNRNSYVVEMRKYAKKILEEKNLGVTEISRILHKNHSTILSYDKKDSSLYVQEEVKEHFWTWFNEKVYPEINGQEKSTRKGNQSFFMKTTYELKSLDSLKSSKKL